MDHQTFLLDLIRIKFGFMALFHYLFVPLTLGLVVVVSCMETAFVWTRDNVWRLGAHFWFRLFVLGWLVGIVTGYPLRAQLATDWGNYFSFVKPVFDQVLPIEADIGPVMIIAIAAIAFVGDRLYPVARMFIMWVLTAAMLLQSATILS